MLDSVRSVGFDTAASAPPPAPTIEGRYAADWSAPRTGPAPAIAQAAAAPRADPTAAQVREASLLSADVYNDVASPPPGFRVASEADLRELNITTDMLERPGSSFRARVYATGEGADTRYVVAFRGSSSGEDWRNNFQQGFGLGSESYAKALLIGERLSRSDANVSITGHSLGGGLASAAGVASGRDTITFNAAGLHDSTIGRAREIAGAAGQAEPSVTAYRVPGEILTFVQEGGDRGLAALLLGVPGALLVDAPEAYGAHRDLPLVVPEDKNWFEARSRVDRHMMDWVLAGTAALR